MVMILVSMSSIVMMIVVIVVGVFLGLFVS